MRVDIYSIPLFYISFKRNRKVEKYLKNLKFKNVNYFKAVDGRKMELSKLIKNKEISARVYNDILFGRHEHSGFPGMGGIGCIMSHYELWKKCVDKNFPYIIIVEDDVILNNITEKDIDNISKIISKPNGIFVGTSVYKDKDMISFIGLQFGIYSQSACKELVKKMYPIDIQADHYIAYLNNIKNVSVEGYPISTQSVHLSSNQNELCIKCMLPSSNIFYIFLILFILLMVIIFIVRYFRKRAIKNKLL
jgi:hypothetical protein